jgi:hypothetical protein
MDEDVNEHLPARFEPTGAPLEQDVVVFHVLEHLAAYGAHRTGSIKIVGFTIESREFRLWGLCLRGSGFAYRN